MKLLALFLAIVAGFFVPAAFAAENHPNFSKYEYAVVDYRGTQPVGADRIQWSCWDDKIRTWLNCSFVKGSLSEFRFVYRRKEQWARIDPNNVCDILYLDIDKISYDNLRASRSRTEEPTDCERVTLNRLRLLRDRRAMALTLRQAAANCLGDAQATSEALASAREDVADTEKNIERYRNRCERDQAAERRQREADRAEADREASTNLNTNVDFSSLASDGRISCFGGCQTNWVSPRGPYSTITSRSWGDKAPPDTLTSVRPAR